MGPSVICSPSFWESPNYKLVLLKNKDNAWDNYLENQASTLGTHTDLRLRKTHFPNGLHYILFQKS